MLSRMQRLRRYFAPLASDTTSPLNLPPVRLSLLVKLNLLTIGIIFLTAISITGYYSWQQWRDEESDLRNQGVPVLMMLAELVSHAIAQDDRANIDALIDRLASEANVAYVCVIDAAGETLA